MKCQIEKGQCNKPASWRLYAPDREPVPGGFYCLGHVNEIMGEYREKLNEEWYAIPVG